MAPNSTLEQLNRAGVSIWLDTLSRQLLDSGEFGTLIRDWRVTGATSNPTIFAKAITGSSLYDTKADGRLGERSPLRGHIATASATVAYQGYLTKFSGPEWERLRALGARTQRPLWASTQTKNPAYSDVLYVEELIGPDVVNTMPERTLRAFADHGRVVRTLGRDPEVAERILVDAAAAGIDLADVSAELEREGVRSFCDSYHELLGCIEGKLGTLVSAGERIIR